MRLTAPWGLRLPTVAFPPQAVSPCLDQRMSYFFVLAVGGTLAKSSHRALYMASRLLRMGLRVPCCTTCSFSLRAEMDIYRMF